MKFWNIFLVVSIAAAQTTAFKSVIGEITAVDSAAKHLTVKGDDGSNYTVTLDDATAYLRLPLGERDIKKAEKIALSDVSVGDRLLARGPLPEGSKTLPAKTVVIMTKADLAKKQAQDRVDWQRRGIAGTVVSIHPDAKEITVNTHGRDAKDIVIEASAAGFRRYAPDSVRFADAKQSSLAELRVGDAVRALGNRSEDGSRYKAEELVSGSFQTIATTVNSVDSAAGEVQVTDLETKKTITVKTNQSSMLRRLPPEIARTLARPGGGVGRDLQQVLDRAPQLSITELKKGDALIISSSKADGASVTAITLVAGVEPFLAAAPRTGGQVNLGSWNIDVGVPEQ